jgi:hypothetical protein
MFGKVRRLSLSRAPKQFRGLCFGMLAAFYLAPALIAKQFHPDLWVIERLSERLQT